MKTFILFVFIMTNMFCYDDSFEDILNKHLLRENTKLLLIKKENYSKSCNMKKCDNIIKYNVNDIVVSSNFDLFHQIKINEWIDPNFVEEIKVYNQKDFRIKLNLKSELTYVLYNGKSYNEKENTFFEIKNTLIAIDTNENIVSNIKSLNNFKVIKSNIIKYYVFNDLLLTDLSLLETISYETLNLLKESKNFKLFSTSL